MALPKLTDEQKTEALKKAQEVRSKRAQVRADLKAGKLTLEEVLQRTNADHREDEGCVPSRVAAQEPGIAFASDHG